MQPFSCVFLKSYVLEMYIKVTIQQSALMTKATVVQWCLSATNVNPEKVFTCNEDPFGLSMNQFVNIILLGSSFSYLSTCPTVVTRENSKEMKQLQLTMLWSPWRVIHPTYILDPHKGSGFRFQGNSRFCPYQQQNFAAIVPVSVHTILTTAVHSVKQKMTLSSRSSPLFLEHNCFQEELAWQWFQFNFTPETWIDSLIDMLSSFHKKRSFFRWSLMSHVFSWSS